MSTRTFVSVTSSPNLNNQYTRKSLPLLDTLVHGIVNDALIVRTVDTPIGQPSFFLTTCFLWYVAVLWPTTRTCKLKDFTAKLDCRQKKYSNCINSSIPIATLTHTRAPIYQHAHKHTHTHTLTHTHAHARVHTQTPSHSQTHIQTNIQVFLSNFTELS